MNVSSSHIKSMWYRPLLLTIQFANGRKYIYMDVPRDVWEAFRASESKGRFFNQNIRGKFEYKELPSDKS